MKISRITMSLIVVITAGCGAQQIANTKQLDDAVAIKASKSELSPAQVCEQAGQSVSQGEAAELRFYAPLHMEQAIENLNDGQNLIKKSESTVQGVQKCYKASQLVVDGIDIKAKAKDMLKDAMAQYDMLKQVDRDKKFADDIVDHRGDIQDLIKEIEAGKIDKALKGQADLLKEMQSLEIEMVLNYQLKPVEAMLDQADDIDADNLAEKTFDKAEKELDSARKFITVNYRNNEEVARVSASAMLAAKHAFFVAKEVETLQQLKPQAAEEKVLYIESLLEGINKKFGQDVVIGHSLYDQAEIVGKRLDAAMDANASLSKGLAMLKQPALAAKQLPATETVEPVDGAPEQIEVEIQQPVIAEEQNVLPENIDLPVNEVGSAEGQAETSIDVAGTNQPVDVEPQSVAAEKVDVIIDAQTSPVQ